MRRWFFVVVLAATVASGTLVPEARAETDDERVVSPEMQQRLDQIRAQRQHRKAERLRLHADATRPPALRAQTTAGRSSPQVVGMATDMSLDIDGDFDLGGYLFKDGVPFLHNDGGATYGNTALGLNALTNATLVPNYPYIAEGGYNTAVGFEALQANTTGAANTAVGFRALRAGTTGNANTALGIYALGGYGPFYNFGDLNTAVGDGALRFNGDGDANVAVGRAAMQQAGATASRNTAIGTYALITTTGNGNVAVGYNIGGSGDYRVAIGAGVNVSGNYGVAIGSYAEAPAYSVAVGSGALDNSSGTTDTAIGFNAGMNWTTGFDNIALGAGAYGVAAETGTIRIGGTGFQSRTFVAGINGATSAHVDGFDQEVCIDNNAQLGPCVVPVSSQRFKQDVLDLVDSSSVMTLRPVRFRYKPEVPGMSSDEFQFGLIAEEVAELFPTLVRFDEQGMPYTVRYEMLTPLLLKELQDEKRRRQTEVEDLRQQVAELRRVVADLKRRDEIPRQ